MRDQPPVYETVPLGWLKPYERNARKHSARQIDQIAASIATSGTINPIITDNDYGILAGEGRYRALRKLGIKLAPVLRVRHLTAQEARAYAIADNRLAEKSSWDVEKLTIELRDLQIEAPTIDLTVTGFELAQIEQMTAKHDQFSWSDLDAPPKDKPPTVPVSRVGDMWLFEGGHRLLCGDSTDPRVTWELIQNERIRQVLTDPPFNRPNKSYSGKGQHQHGDFEMGAGEMSSSQFAEFLGRAIAAIKPHLEDGALIYAFMDWQHIYELLHAGLEQALDLKNVLAWDKGKGGMGSLYRSAHELIGLFKFGSAPHTNNIMLGKNGRDRANVLRYAGMNRFGGGRDKALEMHATVKPVQLIADLLLDASNRGDIVFDGFGGSGTTLIAAHKVERSARLIELSPSYCDTIVERFIRAFGYEPRLGQTSATFAATREARLNSSPAEHADGKYDDRDYEVGKGKPPLHSRFGNRPQPAKRRSRKGSKNADTIIREALDAQVTVTEAGKERKITKFAVAVAQIVNQAAKGDIRAFGVMMELKRGVDSRADPAEHRPLDDLNREFLENLAKDLFPKPGEAP